MDISSFVKEAVLSMDKQRSQLESANHMTEVRTTHFKKDTGRNLMVRQLTKLHV